jgi:SPOR domain
LSRILPLATHWAANLGGAHCEVLPMVDPASKLRGSADIPRLRRQAGARDCSRSPEKNQTAHNDDAELNTGNEAGGQNHVRSRKDARKESPAPIKARARKTPTSRKALAPDDEISTERELSAEKKPPAPEKASRNDAATPEEILAGTGIPAMKHYLIQMDTLYQSEATVHTTTAHGSLIASLRPARPTTPVEWRLPSVSSAGQHGGLVRSRSKPASAVGGGMDDRCGQLRSPRGLRLPQASAWRAFQWRAVSIVATISLLLVAGGATLVVRGRAAKSSVMVALGRKGIDEVRAARRVLPEAVFGAISPAASPVQPGGDLKLDLWEAALKGRVTSSLSLDWATVESADTRGVPDQSELRTVALSTSEPPAITQPSATRAKKQLNTARLPEPAVTSEMHVVQAPNLRKGDSRATGSAAYMVSLAAPRTIEAASRMVAPLARKYAAQLGSHRLTYHRALVGDGIVYRVRIARLTEAEATYLCAKLKTSGASCEVSKR